MSDQIDYGDRRYRDTAKRAVFALGYKFEEDHVVGDDVVLEQRAQHASLQELVDVISNVLGAPFDTVLLNNAIFFGLATQPGKIRVPTKCCANMDALVLSEEASEEAERQVEEARKAVLRANIIREGEKLGLSIEDESANYRVTHIEDESEDVPEDFYYMLCGVRVRIVSEDGDLEPPTDFYIPQNLNVANVTCEECKRVLGS